MQCVDKVTHDTGDSAESREHPTCGTPNGGGERLGGVRVQQGGVQAGVRISTALLHMDIECEWDHL
jgi:hypothetical protein